MTNLVGYTVIDVETTVNNSTIGSNKAFPFHPDNRIVLTGQRDLVSSSNDPIVSLTEITNNNKVLVAGNSYTQVVVGHNLSFDLHYLRKHDYRFMTDNVAQDVISWLCTHTIWDTQVAEYILTGQAELYPSLDGCALKYDAPLKDDRLKIIWDAGHKTEEINLEMLSEYLEGDLEATDIVYQAQMKLAKEKGQLPLIQAMNRAVIAYHDIEYNGMAIDLDLLYQQKEEVDNEREMTIQMLKSQLPDEIQDHVNFGSAEQLSVLLFGGVFKWKQKEQTGFFKNGNPKIRYVEHELHNPFLTITPNPDWLQDKGFYATSDDVFVALLNDDTLTAKVHQFVRGLQDMRGMDKELNSYYNKIPSLLCEGDILHQNINNTATSTSRLSQNQPNLQNMSAKGTSNLKKIFVSRFGDDGSIVEVDYSQLEVIGLAWSCEDEQLLADISAGVDMHAVTQAKVQHLLPSHLTDKEQRRLVKGINFGLLYGGGLAKLSKQSGLPTTVIKKIKDALYGTYPGIKRWQDANVETVENNKTRLFEKSKKGFPISRGTLWTPTGRVYTFKEGDALPWQKAQGVHVSFNRSQICNYPIQGFATGDIVPTVIGDLCQKIHNHESSVREFDKKCLMINTVHDSIMFDIHKDALSEAVPLIAKTMESAPQMMKDIYGLNFNLPLNVEVTVGPNWKEQEVYLW